MEILEIEYKYAELKFALAEQNSKRTKLLFVSDYFSSIISKDNSNITEAYILEFIPSFFSYIDSLEIQGLNINFLSKLKSQLSILSELNISEVSAEEISKASIVLDEKIKLMYSWLNGENINFGKPKIYFPVLEKNENGFGNGFLESIDIEIKNGESKFHISPSEYENDEQLEKQIELCFNTAISYCKKFIRKIKPSHTIYLHFENRLGLYSGNSLGIALTLHFIEAILKHYNSATVVNVNNSIAVTGGISSNSKIVSTSKTIMGMKLETVFFSDVQIFCVPKTDEIWAEEKLEELKNNYPNRDLRIIGLTDLNDLLDRRQIVDIRKQKLIVRSGKFIKKNWVSAVVSVLLAILFTSLFVMDFDDNPAILTIEGTTLFVKNKNGKILWTKLVDLVKADINSENPYPRDARIIDINGDGKNEILLTREIDKKIQSVRDYSLLTCYDKNGKVIWDYNFKDNVSSKREVLNNDYSIYIIDTLSVSGSKSLFLRSSNITSFASAIFNIDLQTRKRLPGTFWCSGHIVDVILKDIDNDGKAEVIGLGYDNGYEDAVFFVFEIDTLTKMRPSKSEYLLNNFSLSEMKTYIRFPKSDYEKYANVRTPTLTSGTLQDDPKNRKYKFTIVNPLSRQNNLFSYEISYNLKDIDIIISSGFRVARDSLVAHEILKPPYTDTDDYKSVIKNDILYWVNGSWVTRNELFKYE